MARLAAWLVAGWMAWLAAGCRAIHPLPSLPPPGERPGATLLHAVGGDLLREVAGVGALDWPTGQDQPAVRQSRQRRQRELDAWFDSFGRSVSLDQCRNDEDRANLRDLHWDMAGKEFLAQPAATRRRLAADLAARLTAVQNSFDLSLSTLAGDDAELLARLHQRCADSPAVKARWFGRGHFTTLGAVYLPRQRVLLINVDQLLAGPAVLIDSLEHELWHHLLPVAQPPDLAAQPWLEGFTEAVAELASPAAAGGKVEYPVQTAYASLFLAANRQATIRHLAGITPRKELSAALMAADNGLSQALGRQHAHCFHLPPARLAAVNRLLNGWGWKEDDGAPMDITRFTVNGRLDPDALNREFLKDKLFAMDLVQALTVLDLRELRRTHGVELETAGTRLPSHLRTNLAHVLACVAEPAAIYREP